MWPRPTRGRRRDGTASGHRWGRRLCREHPRPGCARAESASAAVSAPWAAADAATRIAMKRQAGEAPVLGKHVESIRGPAELKQLKNRVLKRERSGRAGSFAKFRFYPSCVRWPRGLIFCFRRPQESPPEAGGFRCDRNWRGKSGDRHGVYLGGAGVNTSRFWPGSGLGLGFGAFLTSFLPLSLFPMRESMTQKATRRKGPNT